MTRTKKIAIGAAVACLGAAAAWWLGAGFWIEFKLQELNVRFRPEAVAVAVCKDEVLQTAHDPESIEWANRDNWSVEKFATTTDGDQEWRVRMDVRGRNAFGAKIINTRLCTARLHPLGSFVLSMERAD